MAKTNRDKVFQLLRNVFSNSSMEQHKFVELAASLRVKNNADLDRFKKRYHVVNHTGFNGSNYKPFKRRSASLRKASRAGDKQEYRRLKHSDKNAANREIENLILEFFDI